jgi:hypothetical protein
MNTDNLPDLGFDWAEVWTMIQTTGVDFGINLITAIVIFFVGKWVVNLVVKGLLKAMQKSEVDTTLRRFVANLARMLLMLFVIIAAIGALGVKTASLVALIGAAGLAVGLALQGSLSNFAAGVLIVLFRPYKVGDWIEGGGVSGSVEEVQILTTVLKTGDNKRVIIPNSQIMGTTITNYSANETRRVANPRRTGGYHSRLGTRGQQREFRAAPVGQHVGLLGCVLRPDRGHQEALRRSGHFDPVPAAGRLHTQRAGGLIVSRRRRPRAGLQATAQRSPPRSSLAALDAARTRQPGRPGLGNCDAEIGEKCVVDGSGHRRM